MRELTPQAAVEMVLDRGLCRSSDRPRAVALAGGVSSNVVLVETEHPDGRWVLKQPCPKLKVAEDWQCSVERVWREVEVLEICGRLLAPFHEGAGRDGIRVPEVVLTDRANFAYAMTAAPPQSRPWKEALLAGEFDESTAERCGVMLGRLHGKSWQNAEIAGRLDDREFFARLRLEPYYRRVCEVRGGCREVEELISSVWENRWSLVHGDFSPKNLLVSPGQAMLIDFEVGHYGDPAFDLGFFLTHLVAKELHHRDRATAALRDPAALSPLMLADRFWTVYRQTLAFCLEERETNWESVARDLEIRAMKSLGACLLARVDGKSPLEYLSQTNREVVRVLGMRLLQLPAPTWQEARDEILARVERRPL